MGKPSAADREPPAPGSRSRRLAFLLAVLALAAIALVAVRVFGVLDRSTIRGQTAQGTALTLELSALRDARTVKAELSTPCSNDTVSGGPFLLEHDDGVRFSHDGDRVVADHTVERQYDGGVQGRVQFWLRGRIGDGGADGTARMSARFVDPSGVVTVCDSGDVPWAAGENAESRLDLSVGNVVAGWDYPPSRSLAGRVSAPRQDFIDRVERTCSRTYYRGKARSAQAERRYAGRRDRDKRLWAVYVGWHGDQHTAISSLGDPPEAEGAYRRWLDNMGRRVALERRAGSQTRERARPTHVEIRRLEIEAFELARRFGILTCPRWGPATTPSARLVPYSSVDQSQPQAPDGQAPHQQSEYDQNADV